MALWPLVAVPTWLSRKLYKRGSLRAEGPGSFSLVMHNPLASATLVSPPRFVINGIQHEAADVTATRGDEPLDLQAIRPEAPLSFVKGDQIRVAFTGHILRGANRIQMDVETDEFGRIELFVEERRPGGGAGDEEE